MDSNDIPGLATVESLYFFNTLTRKKERFETIEPGKVKIYCCGPTVYNYAHIGNLRTYVFEDVLVRSLREFGYGVTHVMNVTDVGHLQSDADEGDDKMALAAKREQRSPWEIARFYEERFFADCADLNIRRPDHVTRATEHIAEIVGFVQDLGGRGFTYEMDGNVYFDTSKFPDYGVLRAGETEDAVSRVEADERKRHASDFVLWFSKSKFPNQIMKWDSPWGTGFPGWHIECSAMASRYLGERIDIHCGGIDHVPIHHTNEIAQSEARFGHQWVTTWMHGAFLVLDKGKMSKSQGGFLTLQTLRDQGYKPVHYRYLCLTAHYRSELRFSFEALDGARRTLDGLHNRIVALRLAPPAKRKPDAAAAKDSFRAHFWSALADDLNAPVALATLWAAMKSDLDPASKLELAGEFDGVMGLNLLEAQRPDLPDQWLEVVRRREQARTAGDWAKADELRATLAAEGIMVKDTPAGTEWYLRDYD